MKMKSSIKKKLMRAAIILMVVVVVFSAAVKAVSDLIVQGQTDEIMLQQAMSSAEVFVDGQAESVNEQIISLTEKISRTAGFTEYVYAHPDEFAKVHNKYVDEFPETTEVTYHWAAFNEAASKDPAVIAEADLLSALHGEFASLSGACPMIRSLYVATNTCINIGYDANVNAKTGGYYDPGAAGAGWYLQPMEDGGIYVSDAYADTYGRGMTVTISAPFSVNGELRGVIGADVSIQNIEKNILDIDMTGISGYAVLMASDGAPIAAPNMTENTTAADILGTNAEEAVKAFAQISGNTPTHIDGTNRYVVFDTIESTGWKLAVILSEDDILAPTKAIDAKIATISLISLAIMLVVLAAVLVIVGVMCRRFTAPLATLTEEVGKIGDGNFDYESKVHSGDELEVLSDSFENMTVSLKEYIENLTTVTAEKERIGADLAIATQIQSSMLPSVFPPFPEIKTFNIYATMQPAKEVGGDFYDFFMVDEKHLAIVVADVSGKGVPAALFMVIGKTLIKDHTAPDSDLGSVFTQVNDLLCEANSNGLFITAFEGVIDLETGVMTYVNAGHETPFICHKGEKFVPHKIEARFVLAGMEGMRYKAGTIQLEKGDKVFQYTDGVTEATNAHNQLYGMERLEKALGDNADKSPEELLPAIKADIDKFVGDAPQFDDITMLGFEYLPKDE